MASAILGLASVLCDRNLPETSRQGAARYWRGELEAAFRAALPSPAQEEPPGEPASKGAVWRCLGCSNEVVALTASACPCVRCGDSAFVVSAPAPVAPPEPSPKEWRGEFTGDGVLRVQMMAAPPPESPDRQFTHTSSATDPLTAELLDAARGEGGRRLTGGQQEGEHPEPPPEGEQPFRVETLGSTAHHVTAWNDEIVETYESVDHGAALGLAARLNRLFSARSAPAPAPEGEAEPVAWRYRWLRGNPPTPGAWHLALIKPRHTGGDVEIQPLVPPQAPRQKASGGGLREAVRPFATAIAEFDQHRSKAPDDARVADWRNADDFTRELTIGHWRRLRAALDVALPVAAPPGERSGAEVSEDEIEEYIQGLPWSEQATEHEKTLVICNLRTFAHWLRGYVTRSELDALASPERATELAAPPSPSALPVEEVRELMEAGKPIAEALVPAVNYPGAEDERPFDARALRYGPARRFVRAYRAALSALERKAEGGAEGGEVRP